MHDAAGDGVLDPPYRQLYRTTRLFPSLAEGPLPVDPGLCVDLAFIDAPSIVDWAIDQPASGPLFIPRPGTSELPHEHSLVMIPRTFRPLE